MLWMFGVYDVLCYILDCIFLYVGIEPMFLPNIQHGERDLQTLRLTEWKLNNLIRFMSELAINMTLHYTFGSILRQWWVSYC